MKKILSAMLSLLLLIAMSFPASASSEEASQLMDNNYLANILSSQSFTDDQLFALAEHGVFIRNEQVEVENVQDEYFEFDNGDLYRINSDTIVVTRKLNDYLDFDNSIVQYSTRAIQTQTITGYDGAYTFKLEIGCTYDKQTFSGNSCTKITSFYNIVTRNDSSFTATKIWGYATQSGVGRTANGTLTSNVDESVFTTINYPVSGSKYTKSTGFANFVNDYNNASAGIHTEVTFVRNTTQKEYSFYLNLPVVSSFIEL